MNKDTWISWITTGVGLLGSAAATKGLISSSTATTIAGAAVTLVPFLWGLFIHSNSSVVQTAAAITDDAGKSVIKVLVGPTAPQALLALASNDKVPEVVHAATVSPSAPPPKDPYQAALRDTKNPYETTRRSS